jgi:hypothetical protein
MFSMGRFQLAGLFLASSILFAGSHVYASEISFILFFLLCFLRLKFNPSLAAVGLSCLFFYTFFSLGQDRAPNELIFIILLLCLPSLVFSRQSVNVELLLEGVVLALWVSASYALILLLLQITSPEIVPYYELCMYGAERSVSGCGIPPYVIGGFPLQRLYGLASEPSTYGMAHVVLLSLVLSSPRLKVPSFFIALQIITILATISITAITLLIVMLCILQFVRVSPAQVKQKILTRKNLKILFFVISVIFILGISVDGLFDALLGRTYGRLVDLFAGEDTSGFMRTTATWSPVLSFFISGTSAQVLFGMGVNEYLLFIENFSLFTIVDGTLVEFSGQRGSILSTILLVYGLASLVTLFVLLFALDRYRLSVVALSVVGLLLFQTTALSFSTLALIYVVGINGVKIRHGH